MSAKKEQTVSKILNGLGRDVFSRRRSLQAKHINEVNG